MDDIEALFHPRSIAVVGASAAPFSLTNIFFLQPLLEYGYPGQIYPVNPNATEVMGLKAYPSLKDVPGPVDNVVCALPAAMARQVVQDCVDIGARVLTMFTAGFSETLTQDGVEMEKEILEVARRGGLRMVGPNCLGLHCPRAGLSLEPNLPADSGHLGFISQSGGNARDLILATAERRIYFSKLVSYGNAIDLNEADFLEYLAGDEETELIAAYIEGIRQPQRFLKVLGQAVQKKPVIVLKGGTTEAGTGAVASHTGALAGRNETWDAVCRQRGVVQVHNLEDLVDTIAAFSYLKPPRGRRIGLVGMGGGANVISADECERAGFVLPGFPPEIKQELWKFTPFVGTGVRNPIDTATSVYLEPDLLEKTVDIVAGWDGIDFLLVLLPVVVALKINIDLLKDEIEAVIRAGRRTEKPLVPVLRTAGLSQAEAVVAEVQGRLYESGFPVYRSFEQATRALDRLFSYYENGRLPRA